MKKIFTLAITVMAAGTVWGQGTESLLRMSQHNFGLGTARTAAMGGAFVSLGADVSSMSINPAGLAMYSRSEMSISPGLRWSNIKSTYNGVNSISSNGTKTKPVIGSFGAVFANGKFAVGFGSNRVADFSSRRFINGSSEGMSIGDMFVEQLRGLPENTLGSPQNDIYQAFFRYSPVLWNAIMGYQASFLNPTSTDGEYTMFGILNSGDRVYPDFSRSVTGAIDEFVISGAFNIDQIFFWGMTIGLQDIHYRQNDVYREFADLNNTGSLDNMVLSNSTRIIGSGINIKTGVTVRPVTWFRAGLSYHSPTWMSVDDESSSEMRVWGSHINPFGISDTPILTSDYRMRSPSRLLGGVSFTIIDRIIVSIDYERTWYNKMKYRSDLFDFGYRPENLSTSADNFNSIAANLDQRTGQININNIISDTYRPTNNFRIGIEGNPLAFLLVRLGYGYSQSPYKGTDIYTGRTLSTYGQYHQFSGGVGYRTGHFSIDAAYVYGTTRNLPSKFYDYTASDGYVVTTEGFTTSRQKNNNVILTLGYRF